MTDDCLIVKEGGERFLARIRVCLSEIVGRCGERSRWKPRPSTSGHRLLSEDTIERVDVQDVFSHSSRPASLCVPAREASCDRWRPDRTVVRTRRVHGAGSSFLPLDLYDPVHLANEMDRLARLSQTVSVRLLRVPRRLDNLSSVQDMVLADLRKIRPPRTMPAAG